MAVFKDSNGREWKLSLDGPTIRDVRNQLAGLDLADPEGKGLSKLEDDPCLLVDVLWVLCREQAGIAGITDIQFGRALVGDSIEAATKALLEAVVDFFPNRRREMLREIANKNERMRELATAKAMARLADPELEAKVVEALERKMDAGIAEVLTRLSSATDSPESLESPHAA